MRKFLQIALQILIWAAIVAYLVFAAQHCRTEQRAEALQTVEITVTDRDSLQIISPETVRGWLDGAGVRLEGAPLEQVNTREILDIITSHPLVRTATAYVEQQGALRIAVTQRRPVARIAWGDGDDAYISDDLWVMPVRPAAAQWVPVVTGSFGMPFVRGTYGPVAEPPAGEKKLAQNYLFLVNLINFVEFTARDPLWNDEIVQIDVRERSGAPDWAEPEVTLIPRSGRHVIALGTLEDAEEKLAKLALFYRNVLPYEGWDAYGMLDIGYRDQVVARK